MRIDVAELESSGLTGVSKIERTFKLSNNNCLANTYNIFFVVIDIVKDILCTELDIKMGAMH